MSYILPLTKNDLDFPKGPKKIRINCDDIPCMMCVIQNAYDNVFAHVFCAVPGTLRCEFHGMNCTYCMNTVDSDSSILCDSCDEPYAQQKIENRLRRFIEDGRLGKSGKCYKSSYKNGIITCGCIDCVQVTYSLYLSHSVEEGRSPSNRKN